MYRRELNLWANRSAENQRLLMEACRQDVLFWLNAFVWLYEPRPRFGTDGRRLPEIFPMIVWPHQEPVIAALDRDLGVQDIGVSKSRGEGMSWLAILMFMHRWCFHPNSKFGMASYNEDMVDNRDNPDSLFWKIDFTIKYLPTWMVGTPDRDYTRNISRHTLLNHRNGSMITGYATTAALASGSRSQAFLADEVGKWNRKNDRTAMTSIQQTTFSRLVVSTPFGPDGAYYDFMQDDTSCMTKLHLNWKQNPTRNQFLYRVENNRPVPLTEEGLAPDYVRNWETIRKSLTDKGYLLEGTTRSPWYDRECQRPLATPRNIAQELDEDFGGSISRFFSIQSIDRQLEKYATPPVKVGKLKFSRQNHIPQWLDDVAGELRLWFDFPVHGKPMDDQYVIGVDLSAGTGGAYTSNSVASVANVRGKKVAELVSPSIKPERFCDYVIALAHWFSYYGDPAFVIWDDTGPNGAQFRHRMIETEFRNIYIQREIGVVKSRTRLNKPGFDLAPARKAMVLGAYDEALRLDFFVNPSKESLLECKQYVRLPGGKIEHVGSTVADDPSAAGAAHGDRVIADALANYARTQIGQAVSSINDAAARAQRAPPNSFARRREEWLAKQQAVSQDGPILG